MRQKALHSLVEWTGGENCTDSQILNLLMERLFLATSEHLPSPLQTNEVEMVKLFFTRMFADIIKWFLRFFIKMMFFFYLGTELYWNCISFQKLRSFCPTGKYRACPSHIEDYSPVTGSSKRHFVLSPYFKPMSRSSVGGRGCVAGWQQTEAASNGALVFIHLHKQNEDGWLLFLSLQLKLPAGWCGIQVCEI